MSDVENSGSQKDTQKDTQKAKALSAALSQIEKQFGKGAMMRLGDSPLEKIPAISTGSLGLDIALGIGGLPRGRIVEIYGPESSGKTTLTLQVIAEAQKAGGACAFIDAEHALDPMYAQNLGVNIDDLLVSQPDTGEQALEICDMVVRSGAVDVEDRNREHTGHIRTVWSGTCILWGGCKTDLVVDHHMDCTSNMVAR